MGSYLFLKILRSNSCLKEPKNINYSCALVLNKIFYIIFNSSEIEILYSDSH